MDKRRTLLISAVILFALIVIQGALAAEHVIFDDRDTSVTVTGIDQSSGSCTLKVYAPPNTDIYIDSELQDSQSKKPAIFHISPGTHRIQFSGRLIIVECKKDETISIPEFSTMVLPATMIIGFLGAVAFIRRTREY